MVVSRVFFVLIYSGLAISEVAHVSQVAKSDAKIKPAKRDSSDQTASFSHKSNDEPFKPVYGTPLQEQPFRPATGGGYTMVAAAPQVYYEKPEAKDGIQYAPRGSVQPAASNDVLYAPPGIQTSPSGVVHYASSAYRRPLSPTQHQLNTAFHIPQLPKVVSTPPSPPPPATQHEDLVHELIQMQKVHLPVVSPQHQQQQLQKMQYVIALPNEYLRQLHQMTAIPTHTTHVVTLPTRPQAKTHQGVVEAVHTIATEAPASPAPTVYVTNFVQLPASKLHSHGAAPQPYHRLLQQPHLLPQQQQHPALQPTQPQQLPSLLYAYPWQLQQQQQLRKQQQHHQTQHQPVVVHVGGAKPSSNLATIVAPPPAAQTSETPLSLSFAPYRAIFPQQQQQQGQEHVPMSIAHYHQHHMTAPKFSSRQLHLPQAQRSVYTPLLQGVGATMSFTYPVSQLQQEVVALPHYSHPGAILCCTHLLHSSTPDAGNRILGPVAEAGPPSPLQQQPHLNLSASSAGRTPLAATTKYP